MSVLLVILALIFCATSLYPNIQFYDSGELAAASVYLGVGHSPGQPLYAMLSHAFLWLPFGSLGFRLCLFSLACTIFSLLLLQRLFFDFFARTREEKIFVTLALATFPLHAFVHEQAGRIELYSLQMLLGCAALYGYFKGRENPLEGFLISLGAVGLSALNHPLIGLMLTPSLVPTFYRCVKEGRGARTLLLGAAVAAPLLLLLTYVVLRSRAIGSWVTIDSAETWWRYVTGSVYGGNFSFRHLHLLGHLAIIARTGFLPLLLTTAVLWKKRDLFRDLWVPGVLFLALLAPSILQSRFIPRNLDYHGYLLPVLVMMLTSGCAALVESSRWLGGRRGAAPFLYLLSLILSWISWPAGLHSHIRDQRAVDVAYRIMDDLPSEPVMVDLASDSTLFPVSYLQDVSQVRPDVLITNVIRFGNEAMRRRAQLAGYRIPGVHFARSASFEKTLRDLNSSTRFYFISPTFAISVYRLSNDGFEARDILYELSTGVKKADASCPHLLDNLRSPKYLPLPVDSIEELPATALAYRKLSCDVRLGRFQCAGREAFTLGKEAGVDLSPFLKLRNSPEKPLIYFPMLKNKEDFFLYDRPQFLILAAELAFNTGLAVLGADLCLEAYKCGRTEAAEIGVKWSRILGQPGMEKVFMPLLNKDARKGLKEK